VRRVLQFGRVLAPEISMLREGIAILAQQQFTSPRLAELVRKSSNAPASLSFLQRYTHWVRERDKDYLYGPSIYLSLGTHLAFAIEGWRAKHGPQLREWLSAWAEFETLNMLGGHAYEHPDDSFPEFTDGPTVFAAEQLGHPMLAEATCVRNDVRLDGSDPSGNRFYLISGSNMAGKSTLLRSIGTNAVLAMAGGTVRARQLILSPCSICGSISAPDSLLEGKSRFLAEVDRIRLTIGATAESQPVLFVIDEIFSGTNSTDRRVAAEAVVRALITKGAIGALSTHDLALAEIAELPELHGSNVHMSSPDDTKPLEFDYLLKPGVTRQSNALAIARLAGVPV
jgi:DNA mismatch repair ATPase MutS